MGQSQISDSVDSWQVPRAARYSRAMRAGGSPPDPGLLRAGGLHPTLAGQKAIAQRFVGQLAGASQA
jgi:hypothetical protein